MVHALLHRLSSNGYWMPYTPSRNVVHVRHPDGGAVVPVSEDPYAAAGLLLHVAKDPQVPDTIGMARFGGDLLTSVITMSRRHGRAVLFVDAAGAYTLVEANDPVLDDFAGGPVVHTDVPVDVWFDTTTKSWESVPERAAR